MIRVLIVEDSVTQREIFRRLLADDPELVVVAEARNGQEAIDQVQTHAPDVVLMDIHMPDMDGITATARIMELCPVPIVVASATLQKHEVNLAMYALDAGAVSVIEKPEGAVLLHLKKMAPELRRELIAAAKVQLPRTKPLTTSGKTMEDGPARTGEIPRPGPASIIGICASTGGPSVLQEIFSGLPRPFPIPILLVQHISRNFEEGFARWLSDSSGQPVKLASQGQRLAPGIWMSPGNYHLQASSGTGRLLLTAGTESEIHCPSGNPLFESLATQFGPAAVGVQLTGMGDDGATGLLALKNAGGLTLIQNQRSCLIWGMPKAARELGAGCHELSPADISRLLSQLGTTKSTQ